MTTRTLAPLAALGLLASACAPVEQEPTPPVAGLSTERDCFFVRDVDGYRMDDEYEGSQERFYVRTGVRDRWLFETVSACPDLDFAHQIALDNRLSSSICTGDTAELRIPSTIATGVGRCTVRLLGKVADAS